MTDLYVALAAAAIVALLTVAEITERWRTWLWNNQHTLGRVLNCPFCTSWYVVTPLALLTEGVNSWQLVRIPALVTATMVGILLINWSISTYQGEKDDGTFWEPRDNSA